MSNPGSPAPSIAVTLRHWLISHWRLLGILSGLIVLYAVLGFLLVPRLINQYAPRYVHEQLQRQLTLGRVQFNPFTLSLQIHNASLKEANGAPLGSIDYLLVDGQLSSLFTLSYTFKRIQLDAPSVTAILAADGHLNLDFSAPNSPKSATKTKLPAVHIGELQLNRGKVHLEDLTRPTPFRTDFAPIQFTLQNFRTQPGYENAFHFSGRSAAAESFDWQGDFTMQPLGSSGKLQVSNLQASTLQDYLQDALPMRLLTGALTLQGEYQLTMSDAMQLKLTLPSIAVKDLQLAPKHGDATPWVTLPALNLASTEVSLQERSIRIKQVKLSDARVTAWLDAQRKLNLLELLGPDEPNPMPWSSAVEAIAIDNATLQIEDRGVMPATAFKLSPVQVQVQHFSSAPNTSIELNAALHINDQADLNASGTVNLDTLSAQLKLKLANLPLVDLQHYADAATDLIINGGHVNAAGDVSYKGNAQNKNPQLQFSGQVEVADLSTQDKAENKDFIKWQSLQLLGMQYSMAPDSLIIEQVIAQQPYGRVIIDKDGSTNIQHVLRIKPTAKAAPTQDAARPVAKASTPTMRIRIAKTVIENGSAYFTDSTVLPTFSTGMQRLQGSVLNLSSANDSRAKINLNGSVDNYAPVAISGEANFLAAETFSDVSMKFSNMELTTFNPYSGKFAGYSIAKGKLATELHYQIMDRKLDAQHHIVIDQLEFGPATDSKDAVPLPIKLAAALLKDRNGVIDLNLPVSGSIDDPTFKVGPIIWKAVVGLLTKIITAPFAALGSLFGDDSDELSYVDFMPGSAMLSGAEMDKVGKLSAALVQRPQLKLDVPLTVVTDADAAVLNEAAFNNALTAVLPSMETATPTQRLAALTTLYQRTLKAAPTLPATGDAKADVTAARIAYLESILKPQFAISAADRDALTHARADAVRAVLLANSEISPERIYLVARSNEAVAPDGVARMKLQLE